jgi:hypothetical protein
MAFMIKETLDQVEKLTDSILKHSTVGTSCAGGERELAIQQRGALIQRLAQLLQSSPPVGYEEYNRIIILHVQGEQINANLQRIRSSIMAQLNTSSRDRLFAERIADQFSVR